MSFEVVTAGELRFASAQQRERWHASKVTPSAFPDLVAHFELERRAPRAIVAILADYLEVPSFDRSLTYYLDVAQDAGRVTVRGLVDRDGMQPELLAVFAAAAAFGAKGRVIFEMTEGEVLVLACDGKHARLAEGDIGDLDPAIATAILAESERRAGKHATPPAAKQLLATISRLGDSPKPSAVQAIMDGAMKLDAAQRRAVLGVLGAAVKHQRVVAKQQAKKAKRTAARAKLR